LYGGMGSCARERSKTRGELIPFDPQKPQLAIQFTELRKASRGKRHDHLLAGDRGLRIRLGRGAIRTKWFSKVHGRSDEFEIAESMPSGCIVWPNYQGEDFLSGSPWSRH
jgi:hypothetical protein